MTKKEVMLKDLLKENLIKKKSDVEKEELKKLFQVETERKIKEIEEALSELKNKPDNNELAEIISRGAHSLAGNLLTLGNFKAGYYATKLEQIAKTKNIGLVYSLFNSLKRSMNKKQMQDFSEDNTHEIKKIKKMNKKLEIAEKNLKENEEKYRSIIQNTKDLIQVLSPKGNVLFANNSWLETLNYNKKELLKLNILKDIIDQSMLKHCKNTFRKINSGKAINNIETIFRSKNGQQIFVEGNAIPKIINNKVKSINCVWHNITEKKKAENELNREKERVQIILDSVPAWIVYKDKENRLVKVNKTFANVMKMPIEKLEGKTLWDLYPKNQADAYWKDDKEVMISGKPKIGIIEPMESPNGTMWIKVDKIPYKDETGRIIGIIAFAVDITKQKKTEEELKESEEKYKMLIESSPDCIKILDLKGNLLFMNKAGLLEHGFKKESDAISRDWVSSIDIDQRNEVMKNFKKCLNTEQSISMNVKHVIGKSNRKWCNLTMTPLKNPEGKIINVLGISRDISKEKEIEEKFERTYKQLEEIDTLKTDFMDMISHELKSPLNVIISYLDLLKSKTNLNEDIKDKIDIIFDVAMKENKTVDEILDGAQLKSGVMKFFKNNTNLANLIDKAVQEREILAEKKEILFIKKIEKKLPNIYCDQNRIFQVLTNLIINAIKFTKKGSITIAVKKVDKNVIIEVKDSGIGISSEELPNLFNKFYQTKSKINNGNGCGLGLFICKKIVEAHNGKIYAESKLGEGTKMTVILPIKNNKSKN